MKRFLFVDGKMTGFSSVLVIAITFSGILGVLYFQPSFWLGIGILAVSLIIGAIGAAAGAAESIGLKPFTNDPLGWRKAKESYKTDKRADGDASKDDPA